MVAMKRFLVRALGVMIIGMRSRAGKAAKKSAEYVVTSGDVGEVVADVCRAKEFSGREGDECYCGEIGEGV